MTPRRLSEGDDATAALVRAASVVPTTSAAQHARVRANLISSANAPLRWLASSGPYAFGTVVSLAIAAVALRAVMVERAQVAVVAPAEVTTQALAPSPVTMQAAAPPKAEVPRPPTAATVVVAPTVPKKPSAPVRMALAVRGAVTRLTLPTIQTACADAPCLEAALAGDDELAAQAAALRLALLSLENNQAAEAESRARQSLARFPTGVFVPEAHLVRLQALALVNRDAEARREAQWYLANALEAPAAPQVSLLLGDLAFRDGDLAAAASAYEGTLKLKPSEHERDEAAARLREVHERMRLSE